jgi:raffinose/stachyose/melibiose transport system permease protein
MAALVLVLLPILIFYFIMQKKIIAGVADGAIK